MVMQKDNALQMLHLMCNTSCIPMYAQWNIAANANDNSEHITSTYKRTWEEGGYTYTYDALNRLTSAVFTPAEGLADRPAIERDRIPDFSVYYDYDLRGNATNVVRYGVIDAVSDFDRIETFGTLDELSCAYDGNQLSNISAITEALPFDGVTGLHADGEFELSYNEAGDMVSDASRGLLYTRWNADGHPMQYDLEGGHRHYLYWDGLGNHLYTSYETAVTPVSAGALPGRTRRTSVRTYSGDGHVLRGGAGNSAADTLEMIRFAGGYFDENLVPHYYVTDYLGSNIAVIRSDGALVQSVTYYPYGEPHRDPSASAGLGISVAALPLSATTSASSDSGTASTFSNPYLYGGKEYVRRDGLREYIYGARMCIPSETRFSSMDELCELRPWESPYLFCGGNPIRYVDPTGLSFTNRAKPLIDSFRGILDRKIAENILDALKNFREYLKSGKKNDLKKAAKPFKEALSFIGIKLEVKALEESSTKYNMAVPKHTSVDTEAKGRSYYNYNLNRFEMEVPDATAYGWMAHELKHAYQFETGRFGYGKYSNGEPFYDQHDEMEAYDRGRMINPCMPSYFENKDAYSKLKYGPNQVDPKASDADLQKLANDNNAYFKANGKIYSPQTK